MTRFGMQHLKQRISQSIHPPGKRVVLSERVQGRAHGCAANVLLLRNAITLRSNAAVVSHAELLSLVAAKLLDANADLEVSPAPDYPTIGIPAGVPLPVLEVIVGVMSSCVCMLRERRARASTTGSTHRPTSRRRFPCCQPSPPCVARSSLAFCVVGAQGSIRRCPFGGQKIFQ
jgi:hypothetical protein